MYRLPYRRMNFWSIFWLIVMGVFAITIFGGLLRILFALAPFLLVGGLLWYFVPRILGKKPWHRASIEDDTVQQYAEQKRKRNLAQAEDAIYQEGLQRQRHADVEYIQTADGDWLEVTEEQVTRRPRR
jgi:hypothetical protein